MSMKDVHHEVSLMLARRTSRSATRKRALNKGPIEKRSTLPGTCISSPISGRGSKNACPRSARAVTARRHCPSGSPRRSSASVCS